MRFVFFLFVLGFTIAGGSRALGNDYFATGPGFGGGPHLRIFTVPTQSVVRDAFAYPSTGGVRTAVGDVDCDGVEDVITAPGPNMSTLIQVYSGRHYGLVASFNAYNANFHGGVFVASGDVDGDGCDDIVTGAGAGGGPHVMAFRGRDRAPIRSFNAYSPNFGGGVYVAVGDINGDGFEDIITGPGAGGGPHVMVFSGQNLSILRSHFAYSPDYISGVTVASGDVDGDGYDDVITGTAEQQAWVKVWSGRYQGLIRDVFPWGNAVGVNVGVVDMNKDGRADIILGSRYGMPGLLQTFDGSFGYEIGYGFNPYGQFGGGVFVGGGGTPILWGNLTARSSSRVSLLGGLSMVAD